MSFSVIMPSTIWQNYVLILIDEFKIIFMQDRMVQEHIILKRVFGVEIESCQ